MKSSFTVVIRFFPLLVALFCNTSIARAGYGTNCFYLTVNEWSGEVESIDDAKTNSECQPAEKDPKGHWGPIFYGYELSIRFDKILFHTNEAVIATIIYRNAGTNVLYHASPYGGDRDFKIRVQDQNGRELVDSFMPARTTGHGEGWFPGTQYKYQCNLTERYGLSRPGLYTISVHRRLPNPNGNGTIDLYSRTARIRIVE